MPGKTSDNEDDVRWVEVGILGRAHGLKGEIYLRATLDEANVIANASVVHLQGKKDILETRVLDIRRTNKGLLLTMEGVDDRDAASRLTGWSLMVNRNDFPDTEPGEFYYADLEGAPVLDEGGRRIGKIQRFERYGNDVMFFEWNGHGVVAVPMVEAFVIRLSSDPPSVQIKTTDLDDLLQD